MAQSLSDKRQEMYKCRTPPWKDVYRQRCKDRLKQNRERVLALRRMLNTHKDSEFKSEVIDPCEDPAEEQLDIRDIMAAEWSQLQAERLATGDAGISDDKFFDIEGANIHDMISWFEEIQEELKLEEQQLLNQQDLCDEYVKREEEELCTSLKSLSTLDVICPLCERNSLLENKGVIVCKCGLRINTEQDGITLKNVQESLEAGANEHSAVCGSKPVFSLDEKFGTSTLTMSCQDCDFLFIVI
ncbi:RPA-interacting protein A [Aplysia californica]|uniref:RPA-interacting protein A n=1 Tax=Aplysia californica TaxID=6500 RepID=A0ABM0JWW8_APLCA|nr:RPA-interacting protein A [Aplysia californica]XP_005103472.1 RPA-interacting protein A [Aplysia californica]